MKTRIGVIFGGRSGEHEISIRSAKTVIEQLDREKYSVVPIAIDQGGHWLDPRTSAALLAPETAELLEPDLKEVTAERVGFLSDPRYRGLTNLNSSSPVDSVHRIDVAFPVLHGTYGEDGSIQGVFEMADLPYVGCGVLASASGMDKLVMKELFRSHGLPICKHVAVSRSEWDADPDSVLDKVEASLGYPAFVKPANLGSSVGISKADDREGLRAGIALASQFDRKIVVEEALKMREIECAVLGNDDPVASNPGEYVIRDKDKAFLDYKEKYEGTGNNEFVVPAPISEELSEKIRSMAVKAFQAIDGSGLARVDFFLRNDNFALLVNEINTMPGLTDASGYPKMWEGTGRKFSEVLDDLIRFSIERHQDKSRNRTSRTD